MTENKQDKQDKQEFPRHVNKYLRTAKTITAADKFSKELLRKATGVDNPFKKSVAFLAPDIILKAITGDKKVRDVLEKGKNKFIFFISDFGLYEAMGSVSKKEIDMDALNNFLLKVNIVPSTKIELTMDRIDHLREHIK